MSQLDESCSQNKAESLPSPNKRREMINDTETGHNRSVDHARNASTASLFGDENAAGVSM